MYTLSPNFSSPLYSSTINYIPFIFHHSPHPSPPIVSATPTSSSEQSSIPKSIMRPALPLLPLHISAPVIPNPLRTSPRRPPTLPASCKTTWRTVVVPGTAPTMDADVVGVALLAAEARRRGGIMIRERGFVGLKGEGASPLLKSRVRMLEKDVQGLVRTMVRAKAKVRAQNRTRRSGSPIAKR